MKTLFFITYFFLALGTYKPLIAQEKEKLSTKSFIGFSAGGSFLVGGNLTKTDYGDPTSGFASGQSLLLGLEGAYFFFFFFWVGGAFSIANYAVTGAQSLSDGYQQDFNVDEAKATLSGGYRLYNFLMGPYFALPCKRITLESRILIGLTAATSPQIDVLLTDGDPPNYYSFSQNAVSTLSFAFQIGIGGRIELYKGICLTLRADYFYTQPNFTIENVGRQNNTGRLITNYHEAIGSFNLSGGIAYQLGK